MEMSVISVTWAEIGAGLVNWPGIYECLHGCSEEQDHTGAAEGSSALFLLLHRVTSLQIWIHKPQGEPVGVLPLQTDGTTEPQPLHSTLNIGITLNLVLSSTEQNVALQTTVKSTETCIKKSFQIHYISNQW